MPQQRPVKLFARLEAFQRPLRLSFPIYTKEITRCIAEKISRYAAGTLDRRGKRHKLGHQGRLIPFFCSSGQK